jgi:hypothetical protein
MTNLKTLAISFILALHALSGCNNGSQDFGNELAQAHVDAFKDAKSIDQVINRLETFLSLQRTSDEINEYSFEIALLHLKVAYLNKLQGNERNEMEALGQALKFMDIYFNQPTQIRSNGSILWNQLDKNQKLDATRAKFFDKWDSMMSK